MNPQFNRICGQGSKNLQYLLSNQTIRKPKKVILNLGEELGSFIFGVVKHLSNL